MHNKWLRTAVLCVGVYLAGRLLFVPLLPFLIGLSLAVLLEPAVLWCCRRLGFQRKFAAAALTTLLLAALLIVLALGIAKLVEEGSAAVERLPALLGSLPKMVDALEQRYEGFYRSCPAEIRSWMDDTLLSLSKEGVSLAGKLSASLLGKASAFMGKVPRLLLFLFTTLLAIYFTTMSYPEILAFLRRQIPQSWQRGVRGIADCLRSTFWKWLKAESLLCFATFSMLLLGFWYLRLDYTLLLALVIAIVDALPVLGAGTVLVPWALGHLLLGSVPRGVALLALYAIILLVRSLLEPRLMASQAGLPPLSALLAMYLGYCLFGVGGMLVLPIVLLFLKQLRDGGYVQLWQ